MAERAPIPATAPLTYLDLRRSVEASLVTGQQLIEQARVRTYHETGRLIHDHVLLFQDRADYGAGTIQKLSTDLKVDRSVLHRCVRFFERFANVATWPQLSWAHFRELIPVEDPKLRRALANEANRHGWPVAQLQARIRELAPAEAIEAFATPVGERGNLLVPRRGRPGVHRVAKAGDGLVVDLGFACYFDLPADTDFAAGDFVTVDFAGRVAIASDASKGDLFNYRAEVINVVDGDTLWVKIYLRPRQWLKQKLRLRGLDCPERNTPEGKTAKRFVDTLLAPAAEIVIYTTKPDKYDRYLADVFVAAPGHDEPVFLNNALLTAGHAAVKTTYAPSDWDEHLV